MSHTQLDSDLPERYILLTELLAKCQEIKRMIELPNGERESDSHHSFSLAIIAFDFCTQNNLGLDFEKVLLYALVHDLLEIVTGDEPTLMLDKDALEAKHKRERKATTEFRDLLQDYPDILSALDDYERLDTSEAATVFVLDKTCTIWTHFHNNGKVLKQQGAISREQIEQWHDVTKWKISKRLKVGPPVEVLELFQSSYMKMRKELFNG